VKGKVFVAGLALLLVAGGALWFHEASGVSQPVSSAGDPAADLTRFVAQTRVHLDQAPKDWSGWAALAMGYVQLARVTGDPSHYTQAEEAIQRSFAVQPKDNAAALGSQAALDAARHEFAAAVDHASEAVAIDPYAASARGALADGLIELGRYQEAFAQVQQMLDLRPDAASYARASYAYELRGDLDRAIELMRQAYETADGPADVSFALTHLAELALVQGDQAAARDWSDQGMARFPDHPPLLAVRAKLLAAQGDLAGAADLLRRAVTKQPLPGYAWQLGDVLTAAGDTDGAKTAYEIVKAARNIAVSTGGVPDLDIVLYEADNGLSADAVADAGSLFKVRSSNQVADALGWALHAAGRDKEALACADRSLSLGSVDALARFHRGMIRMALGDRAGARSDLKYAAQNPAFSVRYAALARSTYDSLAGPN
jgi:tetratricopeptide (TPR) repeat protein